MPRKEPISLPIHSYSEVLYYNTAFFEENGLTVPATWDELIETSKTIHEITGAPAFGWDNLAGSFMTLVKQYGGRYTDPEGNIYFAGEDSETALKVLNLWKENVEAGIWRTAGEDMFFSVLCKRADSHVCRRQCGSQLYPC